MALSFLPSNTPSTSPIIECIDMIGWVDVDRLDCFWYERNDEPGCPFHGWNYANEEGVTANEACCYCDDALMPSESPSISFTPTKTKSVFPTQSPSISGLPTHSTIPSISPTECVDMKGWKFYGLRCSWYEYADAPGCPFHGYDSNEEYITANEACCYCNDALLRSESPTTSSVPSEAPSISFAPISPIISKLPTHSLIPSISPTECVDKEGWKTNYGDCSWYESNDDPGCPYHGWDLSIEGIRAYEACCYCKDAFKPSESTNTSLTQSQSFEEIDILCRDTEGLDCFHHLPHPNDLKYFNISCNETENIFMKLLDHCCLRGGGEYVDTNDQNLKLLLDMNATNLHEVNRTSSSEQHALFWLLKHDDYMKAPNNLRLVQRFALAVIYYELGGATRWKTCWRGERYSDHKTPDDISDYCNYYGDEYDKFYYTSTIEFKQNFTEECNPPSFEDNSTNIAWLSPTHECEWAFVHCDRDYFITDIHMRKCIILLHKQ